MTRGQPRDVEGFVLAGGRSSRFGANKALVGWRGKPLLDHALDAIRALGLTPRIVCSDPEPYRDRNTPFVLGERPGRGPVEAVRISLEGCATPRALILTADMPGVTPDLVRVLLEHAVPEDTLLVGFETAERRHPFPGIYNRSLLEVLEGENPPRSMHGLWERVPARLLSPDRVPGIDLGRALWNVNRPQDLETGPEPRAVSDSPQSESN